MFKNYFKMRFRILPVFNEDGTRAGVVVMQKCWYYIMWMPVSVFKVDEHGLNTTGHVFPNEESAVSYIESIKNVIV